MSKKAAKVKEHQIYELRDVVLAKIRGYPAWPAMIVDPEEAPAPVQRERPGKRLSFFCVRFFTAGDYAWVLPKDLSKLKKHEIEAYIAEPHKRNGELLNAYRVALDPERWEQEKAAQKLAETEGEVEVEPDEEVDELDGEEDFDVEDKPKTKKRKRDSEAGTKAKSKSKAKKDKDSESSGKKTKSSDKADKATKSKKNGTKSKSLVESEDEVDRADNGGPSKKASPPPAKKAKRDKDEEVDPELENDPDAMRVKDWRHRLQRAFLGKATPKEEDMPLYDALFNEVEEFEMSIKYLQASKIGKVMRHIAALSPEKAPRDKEFKFRDRAQALVNKWHQAVNSTKPNGTSVDAADATATEVLVQAVPKENGAIAVAVPELAAEASAQANDVAMAEV